MSHTHPSYTNPTASLNYMDIFEVGPSVQVECWPRKLRCSSSSTVRGASDSHLLPRWNYMQKQFFFLPAWSPYFGSDFSFSCLLNLSPDSRHRTASGVFTYPGIYWRRWNFRGHSFHKVFR